MKKLLAATAASALFAGIAGAEEVKIGIIYGFTGPIDIAFDGLPLGVSYPKSMCGIGQSTVEVPLAAEDLAIRGFARA